MKQRARILVLSIQTSFLCFFGYGSPMNSTQSPSAAATYQYPFQNPDLDLESRVQNILSLMTLEEKIACFGTVPNVPRLGIKGTGHVEGLHGLALGEPGGWGQGFPVPTTQLPQALGMGETWDPALVKRAGRAEGIETRYLWESPKYKRGGLVVRAPNADLGRDPRWGRTEECFGEDAFFNGTMAVAMTKGLQGEDPKYLLCSSLLKHFLSNSNENTRSSSSSSYDARLFREYYSVPFRMAIEEGGATGVMAAYNAVNSIPCHVHPMLKKVLKGDWGFKSILCTDGGALKMLVTDHKFYPDLPMAAAATIQSGINQYLDKFPDAVRAALKEGLLKEAEMHEPLAGVFRVMIRLGQMDPEERVPYKKVAEMDPWETKEHRELARLVAEKSVVLLKNEGNLLPLDASKYKSIAVIGNNADDVFLDWYSGSPPYKVSPLQGIRERAGSGIKIEFAKGDDQAAAVELAKKCDLVILCVGNHPLGNGGWGVIDSPLEGKESFDREGIDLRQDELTRAIYRANSRTVMALISSFPIAINWADRHLPAILHITHNSQELGHALAAALFGDINPGGRLVQTWPRSLEALPAMMDYDLRHGRTYMYSRHEPLYPFGYGLSYTQFSYGPASPSAKSMDPLGFVNISMELKNSGGKDGDEVVQLYVRHLDSAVERPLKELKGFQRASLKAGESKKLDFSLKAGSLAYWNEAAQEWRVESGRIRILLGASSADIRQECEITVTE